MPNTTRKSIVRSPRVESLEDRNLLTLIGSKPTLEITNSPGVRSHGSAIYITQPAVIQVSGTAQPGPAGSTATVSIFAEDSSGNLVNGGRPLESDNVVRTILAAEARLGAAGRLVIRASGTEPVIRVMAEAEDSVLVDTLVAEICEAVRKAAA